MSATKPKSKAQIAREQREQNAKPKAAAKTSRKPAAKSAAKPAPKSASKPAASAAKNGTGNGGNTPAAIADYEQRTSPREREAVKTVVCPKCNAKTGRLCAGNADGAVRVRPHPERTRLAARPAVKNGKSRANGNGKKSASKSTSGGTDAPAGSTPRDEERAARRALRAQSKRRNAIEKRQTAGRRAIIIEELARDQARSCKCGITPETTIAQLREMGAGCTAGSGRQVGYVCPTLDAIRRRIASPRRGDVVTA